ncbi:MAG TPA: hypothetical protein VGI89_11240 [Rhizomicrobium sp.]|jgi:hypothetical protein
MSISVSPYLTQALAQAPAQANAPASDSKAQPKPTSLSNPPNANQQSPVVGDSVTLSPEAQNRLNKTVIESTMERILDGVKNSTGPKLVFQPVIGSKLDESC